MKSCPTCNRTFEDTFTFCLIDGSVLSAPFDPATGKTTPADRDYKPPPTEVLTSRREPAPSPPTQAATLRDLESTIGAPFVPQPLQSAPQVASSRGSEERPVPDLIRWMFIVRGAIGVLFFLLLLMEKTL